MTRQRTNKTRQRAAVCTYLSRHAERYLSVDDVWTGIMAAGGSVGRTTVYRGLESMAQDGLVLKAIMPGGEARYRMAGPDASAQLVCLDCGRALSLDCHMATDFSNHVLADHGFRIDTARTVLYGTCAECMGGDDIVSFLSSTCSTKRSRKADVIFALLAFVCAVVFGSRRESGQDLPLCHGGQPVHTLQGAGIRGQL